jgi:energy-coupling factor transport system substrate-specific component
MSLTRRLIGNQVARFLLLGGTAALINWLVRFPLALVLPGNTAIVVAYAIGMSAGFALYRRYVFPGSTMPVGRQIAVFLAVNAVGALVVLGITTAVLAILPTELAPHFVREGFAHGFAIGVGAVSNFFGHKLLTFRAPSRASTSHI